ncbi:hypothetical protein [Natranaerobius trueperi]|nr:hypothetical protein [Natranaerobius trueperi]
MNSNRRAAIDIGSNSIRLLIIENTQNGIIELKRDIITTRLAKGIKDNNKIESDAIERTFTGIKTFLGYINIYRAQLKRVVATSAVREASNGTELIKLLKELGIEVEVVDGESEAELTYLGATMNTEHNNPLVFDLGGGSTELISLAPQKFVRSYAIGAVKALDYFGDNEGRINSSEDIKSYILDSLNDDMLDLCTKKHLEVIGVGGTATYLAQAYKKLPKYTKEEIQGTYLLKEDIKDLLYSMNSYTLGKRSKIFNLPEKRAEIIVSGGFMIYYILELLGAAGYRASDDDMLLGACLQ